MGMRSHTNPMGWRVFSMRKGVTCCFVTTSSVTALFLQGTVWTNRLKGSGGLSVRTTGRCSGVTRVLVDPSQLRRELASRSRRQAPPW